MELAFDNASSPRLATPITLTTFVAWRRALHDTVAPAPPIVLPAMIIAAPVIVIDEPAQPKLAITWERARKIFTPPADDNHIYLDQTLWEDEFKATGDWNTKPSRVETFLAHYDKSQTLATLAFIALLILWIY